MWAVALKKPSSSDSAVSALLQARGTRKSWWVSTCGNDAIAQGMPFDHRQGGDRRPRPPAVTHSRAFEQIDSDLAMLSRIWRRSARPSKYASTMAYPAGSKSAPARFMIQRICGRKWVQRMSALALNCTEHRDRLGPQRPAAGNGCRAGDCLPASPNTWTHPKNPCRRCAAVARLGQLEFFLEDGLAGTTLKRISPSLG